MQSVVQYGRVDAARTLAALGVQAPAPAAAPPSTEALITSTSVRGRLSKRYPTRAVSRKVAAGRITVGLTFTGAGRLTLSVVDRSGKTIRSVTGASTLRMAVTRHAGTYRFVVSGSNVKSAPFTLRLSYPSP
jgi:hypothetical protein